MDLPKGKKHKRAYPINGVDFYYDIFPVEIVLNYPVIYVNNKDYFTSSLRKLNISSDYNAEWNLKNPYYQSIVATWIASYAWGVSIQHLQFRDDVLKQNTSLMTFHIYFTIRRFMTKYEVMNENQIRSIMSEYNADFLKNHITKWTWQELIHMEVG